MKTYYIIGLDCANCARKIEEKLSSSPQIQAATLNFATGELRLQSELPEAELFSLVQKTVDQIEPDATVTDSPPASHAHPHQHCHCETHEHEHNHEHEHRHKKNSSSGSKRFSLPLLLLGTSILLLISALLLKGNPLSPILFAVSGLLSGYSCFWKGLKKLRRLSFDENILLLIAFVAAFLIGEYLEACLVIILFSIGEMLEEIAVNNSKKSIKALTRIRPETANLLQDGKLHPIDCREVQVGDLILISPGERIPLDCVICSGHSQVDNAAITGESIPIDVAQNDPLLSGGINLTAALECRVTHSFVDSTASRIIEMVKESAAKKGNAEAFISRFAKVYTPIVIAIAILLAILPPLFGAGSFSHWIYTALILLVASCPCAIVISVPLTFFSCIGAASKRGVLIKGGKYIEALAKADAIALDKTGTLTAGEPSVDRVICLDEAQTENEILALAAACERYSTHPIAGALLRAVSEESLESFSITDYTEVRGMGTSVSIDGTPYLCGSKRMMMQNGFSVEHLPDANIYLANRAQNKVLGAITMQDTLRAESPSVLSKLKQLGIKSITLLSGDRRNAVEACANRLSIDFQAELLPENKVEAIESIKSNHKKTIFVGDGINDAPVLAAADVGIAMGLGSDSAIEAADAVLVSGTLSALPDGIKLSKKAMRIIYFNIIFALTAKLAVFLLALFGMGQMWMAVFADVGVSILSVLNAARLLRKNN